MVSMSALAKTQEKIEDVVGRCLGGTTGPVVAAVSGGADSVALLRALVACPAVSGSIVVAHLDHGLRGGAGAADLRWVRALAGRLGLTFVGESANVAVAAKTERCSLEDAARRVRYRFLERVAEQHDARVVVTGHTRDDQVETVLFRILRGTGVRGLRGITERSPIRWGGSVERVRPLLTIWRAQIESYLSTLCQDFRTDATNADLRFARNRLRHAILPTLRVAIQPYIDDALLRVAAAAGALHGHIVREADAAFEVVVLACDADRRIVRLNVQALRDRPAAILGEILTGERLGPVLGLQSGLPFAAVERIVHLAAAPGSGGQTALPRGLAARREYEQIVIEPRVATRLAPWTDPLEVTLDGETPVPGGRLVTRLVAAQTLDWPSFLASRGPLEEAVDADKVGRLYARGRQPGDCYRPLGMNGTRKLKSILVDRKVPRPQRDRLLVLESEDRIVWPVGCRIAEAYKVAPTTRRILLVRLEKIASLCVDKS